ncbi:MAG: hypothetical protein IJS07_07900, partial [Bacteroidales bacterium]|nr:hypothetical protein [Bacteroidales bacterium]
FDEYRSNGSTITFYYNSDKVAIIDLGDPQMGPVALQSFSPTIPKHMYFCVGNDWKGDGIAPPRCSSPWTDNGPATELACGSGLGQITISGKQTGGGVSASGMASAPEIRAARTDMKVTEEGIRKAFEQLRSESEGKTGEQIARSIMEYNSKANEMMLFGVVTGEMIEMAIARCRVYPHPSLLTTTGNMLLVADDPKTALEYFESASKVQPDFEEPLYGQIESLLDMGQIEKAHRVVPKVIEVTAKRREPDGKAWLYKAMLDAQRNPVEAAGALFKSLSLGYFGENTVSLISSLLNEIDRAEMNASLDKQDFMSLINQVFTSENLENIRKGITYGDDDFFPADDAGFNATPAGDLEANFRNNARIAGDYEARSDQHWDKADKAAQKGPAISLLYAMEAAYLPDNMSRLMEEAKNRPETQKALQNNADARKAIAAIEVPESLRKGLEESYVRLTKAQCFEYNVDGFYLLDARAFWCLRLLERYYKYRLDYVYGVFGDFDDETRTFRGFLPEGFKTNILNHVHRTDKDIAMWTVMEKKQLDEAITLNKKCVKEFDAWGRAHPNASDDAIDRAMRRIFRPYRILTEVTHPLERLNQIEVPSETEKVNSDMVYYNNTIRPVLVEWWKDISKYCSYCFDSNVSNYFWYRTLALIYNEYGSTFSSKAIVGESLHDFRMRILKVQAEIKEEEWQDHLEAIAEHEQAEKDARDLAEFKGRQWYGLSDLFLSMQTPLGEISVGLKEGKLGFHLDVEKSYVRPEPLDAKKVTSSVLTDENVNGFIQNTIQSAANAMGLGGMPAGNVILGMRALDGRLIDTKDETKYNISRDSAGNLLIQKTDSRKYDLAGAGTVTSENIQVGRIKARRDVATYGFGGFFSVSGGSTVIRK